MKNIAIITARSGSKGIKDKNIRLLNGKPLMAYSIEAAIESNMFNIVMVSTDSEEYAYIARKYGAEVPFLRSEELSGDSASSWSTVKEVLIKYEGLGKRFDTVCLLQPTSPLRTADEIIEAYSFFKKKEADAVTSVCECDHPVEYMMQLTDDLSLGDYRNNESDLPRQMLPVYYRLNGAIYIRRIDYSKGTIIIKSDLEYAYLMEKSRSIDIDTVEDFEYAEYLLRKETNII